MNQMKPALLICDLQTRFAPLISNFPNIVNISNKLIQGAKILNIPIIITEQNPNKLGYTIQELDSTKSYLFKKTKFSMYTDEVKNHLLSLNINTIILVGIQSEVCILLTTLELLKNNFKVFVIKEAIGTQNKLENPIALDLMKSQGALITSSDSILFNLLTDSNHPSFKLISNLVKDNSEITKLALQASQI